MFKTRLIAGLAFAGLFAAVPAWADRGPGYFDLREERQDARIAQGVHSGELTRGEARDLRRAQEQLQHLEWRLRRDGRLSKQERRRLEREYDALSERIHVLKHNDRYRTWDRHGPHRHGHHSRHDERWSHAPAEGWWAILGYSSRD
jgi:hypothetical protein